MWIFVFCFFLLFSAANAEEEKGSDETKRVMDSYIEFYGGILEDGADKTGGIFFGEEEVSPLKLLKKAASGDLESDIPQLMKKLFMLLLGEVSGAFRMTAAVLGLSVLGSCLSHLDSGFGKSPSGKAAYYAVYILIAGIVSASFCDAAKGAADAVRNLGMFMRLIVPAVITALVTSGAAVSASVFEPVLISVIEISVSLIEHVMIPLVMVTAGINIISGLTEEYKADRLVKLLSSAVKWGLGVMMTVFISTAGLQSIAATGVDSLTLKLSKFAAANLIPVVGGILAESCETVMKCSAVIKNSVGVVGIIAVILTALTPILKISATLIIFRLSAAAAEPVGDPKIIKCISQLADSISLLFSMLAAVTVMFVIILTVTVNAGNSALML